MSCARYTIKGWLLIEQLWRDYENNFYHKYFFFKLKKYLLKNNFLIEFPGGLEPKIWSGSAANLSIDRTLHFQGVIKVVFSGHLPLVEWYFWFTTVHFIKDDRDILISYIKQLFFFLDRSFRTWSFGISMKLVHCNFLVNYNVQCRCASKYYSFQYDLLKKLWRW